VGAHVCKNIIVCISVQLNIITALCMIEMLCVIYMLPSLRYRVPMKDIEILYIYMRSRNAALNATYTPARFHPSRWAIVLSAGSTRAYRTLGPNLRNAAHLPEAALSVGSWANEIIVSKAKQK